MAYDPRQVVTKAIGEIWSRGNVDHVNEAYAEHYRYRGPLGEADREELKQFVRTLRAAFPDMQQRVLDVLTEGERCTVTWRITGTHEGDFMGVEPTGKQGETEGCTVYRLENARIVEEAEYWDTYPLFELLGLVPTKETLLTGEERAEPEGPPT